MLTCRPSGDVFVLAGAIDEHARLCDLISRARGGRLTLDLDGIRFINSIGVREWIRLQDGAQKAGLRVELRRVPEILVHQLNIVTGARGSAMVTSFYAPYVCDECDHEQPVLLDVTTHGRELARKRVPAVACGSCGAQMALADPPDIYLSFLG